MCWKQEVRILSFKKYIQGRINFIDEQIHTVPFIVFSFSESLFPLRVVLHVLQYLYFILFLDCEKDNKRVGMPSLKSCYCCLRENKKWALCSWYVGRWMQKSVLSKALVSYSWQFWKLDLTHQKWLKGKSGFKTAPSSRWWWTSLPGRCVQEESRPWILYGTICHKSRQGFMKNLPCHP